MKKLNELPYNGRELSILRVHQPIHIYSVGQLGPAIDQNSAKKLNSLKLYKVMGGAIIIANGTETYIPDGNIVAMTFAPLDQE